MLTSTPRAPRKYKPAIVKEDTIQVEVANLLRKWAAPGVDWWHTPNGGHRSAFAGAKFKMFGVKPGVADLALLLPGHPHARAAFLELKTERGTLSVEQKAFRDSVVAKGCLWAMARSKTEAYDILNEWGALVPDGPAPFWEVAKRPLWGS